MHELHTDANESASIASQEGTPGRLQVQNYHYPNNISQPGIGIGQIRIKPNLQTNADEI